MLILAIETSCDETAAALVEYKRRSFFIHSNIISSQVKIHSKYGGIVPEVAARNHVKNIIPVIDKAMGKVNPVDIDVIAVVNGPGLITSLIVGAETAKALAFAWGKPLIAVNHLEAHIYSALAKTKKQIFEFPALALIVSGGHTQLVLMKGHGKYKIVGETRDDAAGEAFDKAAKLLGLEYPGGPAISAEAENFSISSIKLPRPMIDSGDFDFSFSGLKTAVFYETRGVKQPTKSYVSNVCAEFQQAVIDVLAVKTQRAVNKYKVKNIILAGGVSANQRLRERFAGEFGKRLLLPGKGLSTDNAAMVGVAGVFHYLRKDFIDIKDLRVDPNLNF